MLDWLQKLQAEANQPPARPRVLFYADNACIGCIEPDCMRKIALKGNEFGRKQLLITEQTTNGICTGWRVAVGYADTTSALMQLASMLRDAGLAGAWRDEQLAVRDEAGAQIATIERAAVRPLGITTLAVHLVGQAVDGRFWVQQRAFNKPNDPGKWDTLMGGMVSAGDTVESALQRETWEEAGLHTSDLQSLRYGARLSTQQPANDSGGAGYVREHIDWYTATVPEGILPNNQDGEVAQFALMDKAQLLAAMRRGEFTLEAALIMAAVLKLL